MLVVELLLACSPFSSLQRRETIGTANRYLPMACSVWESSRSSSVRKVGVKDYSANFLNVFLCRALTFARAIATRALRSVGDTGAMVTVDPSVVISTGSSGRILRRSRIGRSMTSAQLLP